MDGDRSATLLGFLGAVVVLLVLFWLVGIDEVLAVLSGARAPIVALVLCVAVVWLSSWGMALHTVLAVLDVPVPRVRSILLFTAAIFSNNVTPFGQAGGEPLSALLISQAADSEYETGLAAIASVDALHFVPSVGLALLGVTYFAVETVTLGRNLLIATGAVIGLALAIPVAAFVGWRYRYELEASVVRLLTPVIRAVGRVLPGREPAAHDVIERRIEGFFAAIDRVAASRRTLAAALGYSLSGWVALSVSLWLSVYALGTAIPLAAALVVIPVGSIAGVTPLPGGLGGVEAAFVVLLISTTGIGAATASAAVVIHRVATYWLPTLIGGGTAAALGAQRGRQRRRTD
ncbi:MAG: YbhN family protein [Haloarculaceae archaeon]